MGIPTEAIGSVPRPAYLLEAMQKHADGALDDAGFAAVTERAVAETLKEMEATGSQIITDGEQSKPSFISYPLAGLDNLAGDGVVISFEDGHTRQLPRLTKGPFRYGATTGDYVRQARKHTHKMIKQAVIAPSALSLIYPPDGIEGYSRDQFIRDLTEECTKDIRSAIDAGALSVQIDFTEGRLSCKLDPSRGLLREFVALNNAVLDRFSEDERSMIGVHTCPGGDHDSTHSAEVDYAELLPDLFKLNAGRFFIQMASEPDKTRVLDLIAHERRAGQKIYIGVIDPINEEIETAETVCERTLQAAEHIGVSNLGTTDDCGFSPFGDDIVTARATAFAKIKARVEGTKLASERLGVT
ncbi:cobalamin-independent methionine synthase II family protein [Denitrobaculum tricleocarpae]|uniref:Cobalamin-independent methionine synthase II family protein n=1 Tax=Denitrobaculum tricleocarpae TaxID=2591009 RepID=A0A545T271_9PROT|nr:cobalamin-independent methionine synthase II family protein [Denitrobaculum tricleocarpae]TQV71314.1 cobalamin-independent methionine synthase II family protein [Denitrobaculum tricleocarpae]